MDTYFEGDIVIYGDESNRRLGVIDRIDYIDMKIGIRSYFTDEGHVEYWVRPEHIIKCLNRYHVGDQVFWMRIQGVVEIIDIGRNPLDGCCWYKVRSVHSQQIYSVIAEDELNGHVLQTAEDQLTFRPAVIWDMHSAEASGHITPYVQHLSIDKVIFNDPATIIIWKDGTKTVVKTAPGETYNKWAGMALCISKKLYGDRFHRIFKEYCGVEEPVELTECEKAYVNNDIQACAEKRKDLGVGFAMIFE